MTAILLEERSDRVLRLTLNRPEARNALSIELMTALVEALGRAAEDPHSRVVVIAGAGPAFCAGHDLRELTARRSDADGGRGYFRQIMETCSSVMQAIVGLPQPVIAAVTNIRQAGGGDSQIRDVRRGASVLNHSAEEVAAGWVDGGDGMVVAVQRIAIRHLYGGIGDAIGH